MQVLKLKSYLRHFVNSSKNLKSLISSGAGKKFLEPPHNWTASKPCKWCISL